MSQLNDQQNKENLGNSDRVIVNPAFTPENCGAIKAIAFPGAKLLASFNAHNIYLGGTAIELWNKYRAAMEKYTLKNSADEAVKDLDYPDKNLAVQFTKEAARAYAAAWLDMIDNNVQIDGIYVDDLWGDLPPRYINYLAPFYPSPTDLQNAWDTFRRTVLSALKVSMRRRLLVCNTAGALAPGAHGISIEEHTATPVAATAFYLQGGTENIRWFADEPYYESQNFTIRTGIRANN